MRVIEHIAKEVNATGIHGEHLVVLLNFEFQLNTKIFLDFLEYGPQLLLAIGEENHIIYIAEVILDVENLFHPMVEIIEVNICQILRKIVANREAIGTVYNLVENNKDARVFDNLCHLRLQNLVIYARVIVAHVQFETVFRALLVKESPLNRSHSCMNASAFDTGEGLRNETLDKDRL